jgi:hypothetical protein
MIAATGNKDHIHYINAALQRKTTCATELFKKWVEGTATTTTSIVKQKGPGTYPHGHNPLTHSHNHL